MAMAACVARPASSSASSAVNSRSSRVLTWIAPMVVVPQAEGGGEVRASVLRSDDRADDVTALQAPGRQGLALRRLASRPERLGGAARRLGHDVLAPGGEEAQGHGVAAQQLPRPVHHRLEDPVELLEARDLHADAVERLGLPHLLLERAVRAAQLALVLLQPVGHDVEGVGEQADLVRGADPDPGLETALGEAPGGVREPSQGGGDAMVGGEAGRDDERPAHDDEGHVQGDDGMDQVLAALQQAGDAGSVELGEHPRVAGHLVGRPVQPLEVGLGETPGAGGQALRDGQPLLAQPAEVAQDGQVLLLGRAELASMRLAERRQLPHDLLLQEQGIRRAVAPSRGVHLVELEDQVVEDGVDLVEPQDVVVLLGHGLVVLEDPGGEGERGPADEQDRRHQHARGHGQGAADPPGERRVLGRPIHPRALHAPESADGRRDSNAPAAGRGARARARYGALARAACMRGSSTGQGRFYPTIPGESSPFVWEFGSLGVRDGLGWFGMRAMSSDSICPGKARRSPPDDPQAVGSATPAYFR